MAVTIALEPQLITTAGNPMIFEFSSDQISQSNFAYIIEVYLNNILIATDRVEVVGIVGSRDISGIIQRNLQRPHIASVLSGVNNIGSKYRIVVREYYGAIPTYQGYAESSIRYAFNGNLPMSEWIDFDYTDFEFRKWLSDYPSINDIDQDVAIIDIVRGQPVPLAAIQNVNWEVTIQTYDSDGNMLESDGGLYIYTDNELAYYNFSDELILSTFANITDLTNVAYFTISSLFNGKSVTFRYIDDECEVPYTLIWMNKWGAFDCFSLSHNISRSADITSYNWRKGHTYNISDGNINWSIGGVRSFLKVTENKGELTSEWLNSNLANYFQNSLKSPLVYLYKGSDLIGEILITDRSITEFNDKYADDLINISINFSIEKNNSVRL